MALATKIRILTIPPGEAPLSVRMAWVGLDLPLDPRRVGRQLGLASGVLSSPQGWWQRIAGLVTGRFMVKTGYAVNALEAVNLLQAKDPVAAAWWREHCAHLLDGKRSFLFPSAGCEESVPDAYLSAIRIAAGPPLTAMRTQSATIRGVFMKTPHAGGPAARRRSGSRRERKVH